MSCDDATLTLDIDVFTLVKAFVLSELHIYAMFEGAVVRICFSTCRCS